MKSFNLEAAKRGEPVQTRDGRAARIICLDRLGEDCPIVALVKDSEGYENMYAYTTTGAFTPMADCTLDLVMVPVQREGWVNVYSNKYCNVFTGKCVYETEAEARSGRSDNNNYVATAKMTWEE